MASKHSIRTFLAVLSAIAIWIAALLQALQSFGVTHDENIEAPNFNSTTAELLRKLDPPTLRQYWAFKKSQASIDISIDLLFSLGLLSLAYCVLCLKRVFRRWTKDSDLPNFMTGCFFFGALIPSLQFLQTVGSTTTSNWVAGWQGLPDVGFQILYVSNVLDQGRGLYLLSVQFLFISIGMSIVSHLSWKTGDLPKKTRNSWWNNCSCWICHFPLRIFNFPGCWNRSCLWYIYFIMGYYIITNLDNLAWS